MANAKILVTIALIGTTLLSSVYGAGRIVGGQETTIDRRPYSASLQYIHPDVVKHNCGATIISDKFLLSAAHCDPGVNIPFVYARMGTTSYNQGGLVLKVTKFIKHPLYSRDTIDYDYGIVGFADGVTITLGPNIAVIPLTNDENPADGSMMTVSGWGVTSESATTNPQNLREVNIPVVNQDVCRGTYSFLTQRHLCIGGTPQGGTGACFGDSGGPAIQNGIQYGIVSGGNSCDSPNVPALYARISAAREWITQQTGV